MGLRLKCWLVVLPVVLLAACDAPPQRAPAPRPVSVMELTIGDPASSKQLTATVVSWKTENIGFEVDGRVQYVVEPDTDIEGRTFDEENQPLTPGTVLAKIDDHRYRLRVASAMADLKTAKEQREAMRIEIAEVIPAEKRAELASLKFWKAELKRLSPLVKRGTVTRTEFERKQANHDSSVAKVARIDATKAAKTAELASLDAKTDEAKQVLADARRDVNNCILYSPYHGQAAKVSVIPGGFVQRGQPVVTVQMMHPIKVEFEASAAMVRQLNYSDTIPVTVSMPDGTTRTLDSTVYITDPVADPGTRTFTVTLLVRNEKIRTPVPEEMKEKPVVRTTRIWRIMRGTKGFGEGNYIEEKSLRKDKDGYFLWRVTNRQIGTPRSQVSPKLSVAKIRVTPGAKRVSFLGLWTFRSVAIDEGEAFNAETDVVAGRLTLPEGVSEPWEGQSILFDQP